MSAQRDPSETPSQTPIAQRRRSLWREGLVVAIAIVLVTVFAMKQRAEFANAMPQPAVAAH